MSSSHSTIAQAYSAVDEFQKWLLEAPAGARYTYHRGSGLYEAARIADAAWDAHQRGLVHLLQRREGPSSFSYIAERRPS